LLAQIKIIPHTERIEAMANWQQKKIEEKILNCNIPTLA
jgi:hypothetical protein